MLRNMSQIQRLKRTMRLENPLRKRAAKKIRVNNIALVQCLLRGHLDWLDTNDAGVAMPLEGVHQSAVVAADVDDLPWILVSDGGRDQVVQMPRFLKAGRIGIRVAIEDLRLNDVDDLQ